LAEPWTSRDVTPADHLLGNQNVADLFSRVHEFPPKASAIRLSVKIAAKRQEGD